MKRENVERVRMTANIEAELYERLLMLRAKKHYRRMSVSGIVNELLEIALDEIDEEEQ